MISTIQSKEWHHSSAEKPKYISGFTPNYCTWHNGWCRIPSTILRNHHKILYSNQPGSIGHSFKDANSAGLLPVNTQLELRSIIGILKIDKTNIFWPKLFHMALIQENKIVKSQTKSLKSMLMETNFIVSYIVWIWWLIVGNIFHI